MKALVFLLVLGNVLFFAYTEGYFGRPDNPDAGRLQQQLNAENIRLVSRGEPPSAKGGSAAQAPAETVTAKDEGEKEAPTEEVKEPVKEVAKEAAKETAKDAAKEPAKESAKEAAKEKPVPDVCIAWNGLSVKEADRLAGLLGDKFAAFKVARQAIPVEGGQWWVFIPPLANKADADKKAGELKRMGVAEYFVIQDAGPNRFAISLGVFSSQGGAEDRLAELKGLGVRSAKIGPRSKDALYHLEARGPGNAKVSVADAARRLLPETEPQGCK